MLSLSRIEYLYKLENKFGDRLRISPRLPLLALERAMHGVRLADPSAVYPHFAAGKRARLRADRRRSRRPSVAAKLQRYNAFPSRQQQLSYGDAYNVGERGLLERMNYPRQEQLYYSNYMSSFDKPSFGGSGQQPTQSASSAPLASEDQQSMWPPHNSPSSSLAVLPANVNGQNVNSDTYMSLFGMNAAGSREDVSLTNGYDGYDVHLPALANYNEHLGHPSHAAANFRESSHTRAPRRKKRSQLLSKLTKFT